MGAQAGPVGRQQAARWLRTAQHDLEAARWSRQGEFYNTACFHAQHAAEKALTAFLLAQGESGVHSHSARELLERCKGWWAEFEGLRQDCRVLDRHYIPTRYPDALPEVTPVEAFGPEDADDAIRRAERVLQAVQRALQATTRAAAEPAGQATNQPGPDAPEPPESAGSGHSRTRSVLSVPLP